MKVKELILFLLLINSSVQGQIGALDYEFGNEGVLETNFNRLTQPLDYIEITADNKILLGFLNYGQSDSSDITLLKLLEDGQIDKAFGNNGYITTEFDQKRPDIYLVHTFPNKTFQLFGSLKNSNISKENSIVLIRYTEKGLIDTSYGNQGKIIVPSSDEYEVIRSVYMQTDSTFLVIASNSFSPDAVENAGQFKEWYIKKYDLNGNLDETYGDKGIMLIEKAVTNITIRLIQLMPNGQIYVAGVINSQSNKGYFIKRYSSEVKLDTTFGIDGMSNIHFNQNNHSLSRVKIGSNDKILILGSVLNIAKYDFALAQLNLDGSLDNSFGENGKVTTELTNETSVVFQSDERAFDMTIQSDGKIIVVGYTSAIRGFKRHQVIVRYNPDGTLDEGFGDNGKLITKLTNRYSEAYIVLPTKNERILVAGNFYEENYLNEKLILTQYTLDQNTGILNNSLNTQNVLVFPNPIKTTATLEYTLEQPETLTIQLTDLQGRILKTYLQNHAQNAGAHQLDINLPAHLSKGMYFLRLSSSNGQLMVKVMK